MGVVFLSVKVYVVSAATLASGMMKVSGALDERYGKELWDRGWTATGFWCLVRLASDVSAIVSRMYGVK